MATCVNCEFESEQVDVFETVLTPKASTRTGPSVILCEICRASWIRESYFFEKHWHRHDMATKARIGNMILEMLFNPGPPPE